jgi:hypothetical protein
MSPLSFLMFNARSLSLAGFNNKKDSFYKFCSDYSNSVICIVETWLNSTYPDSLLDPNDRYNVYRQDRLAGRGGGIAILVPKFMHSASNAQLSECNPYFETLVITLFIESKKYTVAVFYRMPKPPPNEAKLRILMNKKIQLAADAESNCFIMGDFNYPEIDWDNLNTVTRRPEREFITTLAEAGLTQFVNGPTHIKNNCLDLFFTNSPNLIKTCQIKEPLGHLSKNASDHNSIFVETRIEINSVSQIRKFMDFKNTDYLSLEHVLLPISWPDFFSGCANVDQMYDALHNLLSGLIDIYVPIGRISDKNGLLPRWGKHLVNLCRLEIKLRRRNKELFNDNLMTINHYMERLAVTRTIIKFKRNQIRKHERRNIPMKNSKAFFKYYRKFLKTRNDLPALLDKNGIVLTDDLDKAKVLNETFASNYVNDNGSFISTDSKIHPQMVKSNVSFEDFEICKLLQNLPSKCGFGPDRIPYIFLKKLAVPLAQPLAFIFRHSFLNGVVPQMWKAASITPIAKIKNSAAPNDYRPISITSNVCKVMEKVIAKQLLEHCSKIKIFDNYQFGFVPGKSAEQQLLQCLNDWTINGELKIPTDVIYIDFAKAFDRVARKKLLQKLKKLGFHPDLIAWIKAYLTGRTHFVKVGEQFSETTAAFSGVPQGSVIGPILFCIFIYDLPLVVKHCKIVMFADDVKLYFPIRDNLDAHLVQIDLNAIQKWSIDNQLPVHPQKSTVLHLYPNLYKNCAAAEYTLFDVVLPTVKVQKDLGVLVDENLTFETQMLTTVKKCKQTIGCIKHCFRTRDPPTMLKMFCNIVRPKLEYCSSVWHPHTKGNIKIIEKVQRYFSFCLPTISHLSYNERLELNSMNSILYRRIEHDLVMVYKHLHSGCTGESSSIFTLDKNWRVSRTTRGHSLKITKTFCKNATRVNFWSVRTVNIWNQLPESVVQAKSVKAFKIGLLSVKTQGLSSELVCQLKKID